MTIIDSINGYLANLTTNSAGSIIGNGNGLASTEAYYGADQTTAQNILNIDNGITQSAQLASFQPIMNNQLGSTQQAASNASQYQTFLSNNPIVANQSNVNNVILPITGADLLSNNTVGTLNTETTLPAPTTYTNSTVYTQAGTPTGFFASFGNNNVQTANPVFTGISNLPLTNDTTTSSSSGTSSNYFMIGIGILILYLLNNK